jgi:tRNA(fMet)-specific endonuclease VapC
VTLRYLLDTNVVSEWVKPTADAQVVARLTQHEAACAIAAPTLEELAFGMARLPPSRRRDQLEQWLAATVDRMPVLPFDARAAWWLGVERARLARLGRPAPRADGEIAAIAVAHGLILVTHNVKDFAAFSGLRIEDWSAA